MVTATRRALPALRRLLPRVLGLAVVIIAVANLIDVVWPDMAGHFEVLALLVPQRAAPWAHALAGPVAVLLIGVGWALTHRRHAALAIAVSLLGVMAVTMAGEQRAADAAACAVLAALLYLARGAFPVMPAPDAIRHATAHVPFAAAVPEISGTQVLNEAMALLMWRTGPADFPATFHRLLRRGVSIFELLRREVPECRVQPQAVVEGLDVVEHRRLGSTPAWMLRGRR